MGWGGKWGRKDTDKEGGSQKSELRAERGKGMADPWYGVTVEKAKRKIRPTTSGREARGGRGNRGG